MSTNTYTYKVANADAMALNTVFTPLGCAISYAMLYCSSFSSKPPSRLYVIPPTYTRSPISPTHAHASYIQQRSSQKASHQAS